MNSVSSNKISLKYYRLAPSGCQTIRIRNFELVAKTQFLSSEIRAFLLWKRVLPLPNIFPYVPRSTKIFQILVFIRNWISKCCCSYSWYLILSESPDSASRCLRYPATRVAILSPSSRWNTPGQIIYFSFQRNCYRNNDLSSS